MKPELFRHEKLQDVEAESPGHYVMLVFIGLFTQCDKNGVFLWKPRQLKLDILPFLDFNMDDSLALLCEAGFVSRMIHGENEYGVVLKFKEHQRITGKEAQEKPRFPSPEELSENITEKTEGSNRGATGKQQGAQERERERERKGEKTCSFPAGNEKSPSCPHEEIIFLYHSILTELPAVRVWGEENKKHLRARWREDKARQSLDWWSAFFGEIKTFPFLMGEKKDFQATLGWIVGPKNFSKILNGTYRERAPARQPLSTVGMKTAAAAQRFVKKMGGTP